MLKAVGVLAVGKNVSPKKFVRIQLYLQIYLLATSIVFLTVSGQLLTRDPVLCFSTNSSEPSQQQEVIVDQIATRGWDEMRTAGEGMLVYGLALFPSSLLCIIIHSFYGYIATVACVRAHILTTVLLWLVCVYSLVRTILLVTLSCGGGNLLTWLPAIVPLYVMAATAHVWIAALLVNVNVFLKTTPLPPKIILETSESTSALQDRLGQAVHVLKNPSDLINGRNRHRLNSLQSLHVDNLNSVVISDIPLTPNNNQNGLSHEKFQFCSSEPATTMTNDSGTLHPSERTACAEFESTIYQYLSDFQLSSSLSNSNTVEHQIYLSNP